MAKVNLAERVVEQPIGAKVARKAGIGARGLSAMQEWFDALPEWVCSTIVSILVGILIVAAGFMIDAISGGALSAFRHLSGG